MPNKKNNESQKEKRAERTYSEDEVLASMSDFTESFRQVIYRELYDQDTEGSAVPANETGVIKTPFLGTTLLYSRPDMINPKEANQQSDVQSARTTMKLKKSTSLPFAHNLHQETENDSIWLFEVLDNIGVNDGYRKICREEAIIQEIINTFSSDVSVWNVGSYCEGTFIPGIESDADTILCYEVIKVVEAISIADVKRPSLLIVRESQTPAGYVKLQFVACCVPIELNHWPAICAHWPGVAPFFTTDKLNRIVLIGILSENLGKCPLLSRAKNKPAAKLENYPSIKLDMVQCYRCKAWPTIANEWLTRHRCYGWPTTKTIEEMKLLGFLLLEKVTLFHQKLIWSGEYLSLYKNENLSLI